MAIRTIRVDGDDILRKVCKPVKEMNERTIELINDMYETMYEAQGVGVAAPQVGVLKRIAVVDVSDAYIEENATEEEINEIIDAMSVTLINAKILKAEGEQVGGEGCLSIPGKIGKVTRPDWILVENYDEELIRYEFEAEGFFARAICHELDHLDGILYKDKAEGGIVDADDYVEEGEEEE